MNQVIPKQIAIEVTSRCQLRCQGCMKTLGYPDQDMPLDFFKSIIDRNYFDATIIPYQNGEPLLHPDIFKMIEYTISKGMRSYITTNGLIWNEDLFQLITEKNRCYQIIFSLDGIVDNKSRSIEQARPGSNRKLIYDHIMRFKELKEKKGNNIDLCLKFCHRGQDWAEMEEFIGYWLNEGIDYICIGRMLNQTGKELRIYPCQYFDSMYMLIRVDGELIPCMYNYDVAIKNYFEIGKLNDKISLVDAYNNITLQKLREDQANGVFHGPCKTCNSAYTGYGFRGELTLNRDTYKVGKLYHGKDYYNEMYSRIDKQIGVQHERIQ